MYLSAVHEQKYKFFPEGEIDSQPGALLQADEPLGFQPAIGTFRGHTVGTFLLLWAQ